MRDFIEGGTLLGMESSYNRMMRNGMSQMYLGEILPTEIVMNRLRQITTDDVIRTAQKYFTIKNFACGILVNGGMKDDDSIRRKIMKIAVKHLE